MLRSNAAGSVNNAEDRGGEQEVLFVVAAGLAGASADRRAVRRSGGGARHARYGAEHPQVFAVGARAGAHRRAHQRLGLAGHRRVPEREVSRREALAGRRGGAGEGTLGQRRDALRLRQPAQRMRHEDRRAIPQARPVARDEGRGGAHPGHLDGVPEAERRAVPLRVAAVHRRRHVRAGGEPLPHVLHPRGGTGQGVLRSHLGVEACAGMDRGGARRGAAGEIPRDLMSFGVYIHFPYCLSKCPYCDFASRAEKVIPQERYTEAVLRELRARSVEFPDREAISIYFGGGTPSLWRVRPDAEVTLEANPGTTDEERFSAFRRLGVNRLSIGVQSFAPAQLVSLGRKHSPHDAVRAFETARKVGFEVRGELQRGGYARYEISNYAQPGFEAVHNSVYWRGGEYVAAGCGACGFSKPSPEALPEASGLGPQASGVFRGRRYANDRSPERYMERVEATGVGEASFEEIDAEQHLRERVFTGLRLAEGIDLAALSHDLGIPVRERYAAQIDRILREDLGALHGDVLRLNERGLDLHTEVSLWFF